MMLNSQIRGQFEIGLNINDQFHLASLKTFLSLKGYEVVVWSDQTLLEKQNSTYANKPSHVLVLQDRPKKELDILIENLISLNSELVFIILCDSEKVAQFESYQAFGLSGLAINDYGIETSVFLWVDQIVSELFLKYQNEQFVTQFESLNLKIKSLQEQQAQLGQGYEQAINQQIKIGEEQLEAFKAEAQKIESEVNSHWQAKFNQHQRELELEKNKNQNLNSKILLLENENKKNQWLGQIDFSSYLSNALQVTQPAGQMVVFWEELKSRLAPFKWRAYYFKFVAELQLFLMTHSDSESTDQLMAGQGASFRPAHHQLGAVHSFYLALKEKKYPPAFLEFCKTTLNLETFEVLPHQIGPNIEGFLVLAAEGSSDIDQAFKTTDVYFKAKQLWALFELIYHNIKLQQTSHVQVKNQDLVTGLGNKEAFFEKLHLEVARSRRLHQPVTLIQMSLDYYSEILSIHSREIMDLVFRQLAEIVKSSSRVNDFVFRTDENELTLLLPHTAIKGGAIRAERLRRFIESYEFSDISSSHVTVSFGMSEFPQLASSPEILVATAHQALEYIQNKSSNKVCLYTPQDFSGASLSNTSAKGRESI